MKLDAETLKRLSPLLDEVLELDIDQREKWLVQRGPGLADLEPVLRQILSEQDSRETLDMLERPPRVTGIGSESQERETAHTAGESVGPYTLIREIGRGGMGDVWLAERSDGTLKRPVALKLPALSLRKVTLLQRFERERNILGSLNHPRIARLYDAGVAADGQPFLALEYVAGETITTHVKNSALDAYSCIALIRQVLDAVQYAHANLIIHRDIKPGNVLVSEEGIPMLLDFGIAKLLDADATQADESEITRMGGRALTLQYAAPEQIIGSAVSIAVDIWAVGVLLYELLTGKRPFNGDYSSALENAILRDDPMRASIHRDGCAHRLPRSLASDLDTIVLKALKKSPADRYPTAAAFSEDLGRWARGEPVLARPDSGIYRVEKFISRHKVATVATTAAAVALIGIASVAAVLGFKARDEAALAMASKNFQLDMFRLSNTDLSRGHEVSARELLIKAEASLLGGMQQQPELRIELLEGIAEAQIGLDSWVDADDTLAKLVQLQKANGRYQEAAMTELDRAEGALELAQYTRVAQLVTGARQLSGSTHFDPEFAARLDIFQGAIEQQKNQTERAKALVESAGIKAKISLNGNGRRQQFAIRLLAQLEMQQGNFLNAEQRLNGLLLRLSEDRATEPASILGVLDELAQSERRAGHYLTTHALYESANQRCEAAFDPAGKSCTVMQIHRIDHLVTLGLTDPALKSLGHIAEAIRKEKASDSQGEATLAAYRLLMNGGEIARYPDIEKRVINMCVGNPGLLNTVNVKVNSCLLVVNAALLKSEVTQAKRFMEVAGATVKGSTIDDDALMGRYQTSMGLLERYKGNNEAAYELLTRANQKLERALGKQHPEVLWNALNVVVQLSISREINDAEKLLLKVSAPLQEAMGNKSPAIDKINLLQTEIGKGTISSRSAQFLYL